MSTPLSQMSANVNSAHPDYDAWKRYIQRRTELEKLFSKRFFNTDDHLPLAEAWARRLIDTLAQDDWRCSIEVKNKKYTITLTHARGFSGMGFTNHYEEVGMEVLETLVRALHND